MIERHIITTCQRVAHRGGAALAPENTLAAFRHALTLPVDAIEIDVQMSRDGYALVFHDETVERLTEGQGNLLDLDLAYLRSLNAAAHFPGGWSAVQRIPLLTEVLDFVRPTPLRLYIEIKASRRDGVYGRYPGIVEAVTEQVLAANMLERALIMSFDWQLLSHVKRLAPTALTAALVSEDVWQFRTPSTLTDLVARVHACGCSWVNIDYALFTPDLPDFFHAHNLRLGVWTVNDSTALRSLSAAGVDALTTDRPDLFTALPIA